MNPLDKPTNIVPFDIRIDGAKPIRSEEDRKEDIIASTGEDITTDEAKAKTARFQSEALAEVLNQGRLYEKSADQILEEADQLARKKAEFDENPDFVLEQALTVNDPNVYDVDARYATNMQIANEIVQQKITEASTDRTFLGYVGDLVDRFLLRQVPIGVLEDLTARTERKGKEVLDRLVSMPPKDFRKWMQDYADEVSAEGVVNEDNYFAALALQEELQSAGFDPDKETKQLLALTEAAPFAQSAVKLVSKTALKASTVLGRTASVKGPEAAGEVGEVLLLTYDPDAKTIGNLAPNVVDLNPQPVRASFKQFVDRFNKNDIIKKMDNLWRKGSFGKVATKAQIKDLAEKAVARYKANTITPIYDYQIVDEGLGNYTVNVRIGRAEDGQPFRKATATDKPIMDSETVDKLTRGLDNARVVPVDENDLTKGYVIEVSERIDLSGVSKPFEIELAAAQGIVRSTIGKLFNNELMGSSALRDADILSTLSQRAEAGRAAVKEVVQPYLKAMDKLGPKSRFALKAVYNELRDGKDSYLRVRYTKEEFARKFKQFHPEGKAPEQKDFDAYEALSTFEEADYLLKTSMMVQRYVQKGYDSSVEIFDGVFIPAKRVRKSDVKVADNAEEVFDISSGDFVKLADLPDEIPVWKLDRRHPDGHQYIVKPISKRIIEPTDVMGYNPGGTRRNPYAKYFIVAGGKSGRLKSLMSAFSEKQANIAFAQIKRIRDAIRNGESGIDEIIKNNNDWNPDVESYDDWVKLVEREGWDLSEDIGIKARDDDIIAGEVENSDVFTGMKVDDYIQNEMRRSDKVLMDFGGGRAYNEDPVNSVLAQFGNSVYTYSNKAYTQAAIVGWVKKARASNRVRFPDGVSENDYETLFRNAEVTGNDNVARRLKELQRITFRRLNMKDASGEAMANLGARVADYVFDTTDVLFKPFGKSGLKTNLGDPTNFLLKVGFQSAFGFLALSQFLMQGFHVTTIMAISPKHGFKAAGLVPAIRGALRASDPKTIDLAVKRLAKVADMSEKDTKELFEYIRTSGRQIVDGDAVEDGTGIGFGLSSFNGEDMTYSALKGNFDQIRKLSGKGLDMGLMPFKSGERLTRLTSMATAFLEWKAKNPRVSALSENARNWISRREQDLTFNMNTGSRGMVQSGLMKVPTQWLTYSMRAMEAVFVGRNFTPAERARLFAVLGPMYGLTGFGLDHSAAYIGEKIGIEPDSSLYVALKYGILDAIADYVGAPVSIGQRLAPVDAFLDTYEKIFEEKTISAIGGPSGEIFVGIASAFYDALGSLINGHTVSLTEDTLKILRQPSGIDSKAKALGILNNGIYRSKNGVVVENKPGKEMGIAEALVTAFGFTPPQVVEFYNLTGKAYNDKESFRKFKKEVNRDAELMFSLIDGGSDEDIQRGIKLMKEIHERIALSGFSFKDQQSLRRAASSRMQAEWPKISKYLMSRDRFYELKASEYIMFNTGSD
jgi:hypothetical protein